MIFSSKPYHKGFPADRRPLLLLVFAPLILSGCQGLEVGPMTSKELIESPSGLEVPYETPPTENTETPDPVSEPSPGDINFIWPVFDWDNKHEDFLKWNMFTFEATQKFGEGLTTTPPKDILSFCPSYKSLDIMGRRMFWISLFAAMTRFESSFNPDTKYTEAFRDVQGELIVSRGLLQLSIESSLGYGCKLNSAQDLHDPRINLSCAAHILNRWVTRDGVITGKVNGIWRGGARYWAVLRRESILASIQHKTSSSEICKK